MSSGCGELYWSVTFFVCFVSMVHNGGVAFICRGVLCGVGRRRLVRRVGGNGGVTFTTLCSCCYRGICGFAGLCMASSSAITRVIRSIFIGF